MLDKLKAWDPSTGRGCLRVSCEILNKTDGLAAMWSTWVEWSGTGRIAVTCREV
jgi:hypothetical protein